MMEFFYEGVRLALARVYLFWDDLMAKFTPSYESYRNNS